MLAIVGDAYKIDLNTPFEKFSPKVQNLLLYGPGEKEAPRVGFRGVIGFLNQNLEESTSETYRDWLLDYMSATECSACQGQRLRQENMGVKSRGPAIPGLTRPPLP